MKLNYNHMETSNDTISYNSIIEQRARAEAIVEICNDVFKEDVMRYTKTRVRTVVEKRQLVMYFLRNITKLSLSEIGRMFGKNHATVLHAIKTINNLIQYEDHLIQYAVEIKRKIDKVMPVLNEPSKSLREELLEAKILNQRLINRDINRKHMVFYIEDFIDQLPKSHKENYKRWMARL